MDLFQLLWDAITQWWLLILTVLAATTGIVLRRKVSASAKRQWRRLRTRVWLARTRIQHTMMIVKVIIAAVASLVLWAIALKTFPLLLGIPALVFVTAMTAFTAVSLLWPALIHALVIDPNENRPAPDPAIPTSADLPPDYPPSRKGFFTYLEPGQSKIIIRRGGSYIRAVMDYVSRKFVGESPNAFTPDMEEYYDVQKTPVGERSSHPIPFPAPKTNGWLLLWVLYAPASIIWWAWKLVTYLATGALWAGIEYYRTILIYKYPRSKQYTETYVDEQARPQTRENLKPTWDYSDHLRVANFPFAVGVPEADTANMVPVRAMFNVIGHVTNPVRTAFSTDNRWPMMYYNTIANAISEAIRHRPVDQVTAARDPATANALVQDILERLQLVTEGLVGIKVEEVQYIDVSTVDKEHSDALARLATAQVERDAEVALADGDNARLTKKAAALSGMDKELAEVLLMADAQVESAQALKENPNAIVSLGSAGSEAIQVATLRELRRGARPI